MNTFYVNAKHILPGLRVTRISINWTWNSVLFSKFTVVKNKNNNKKEYM